MAENSKQNIKVKAIIDEILDAFSESLGAHVHYSNEYSASVKFSGLPALGTLRISARQVDTKYSYRWNIFVFPALDQSSAFLSTTHWYSEKQVDACILHMQRYANTLLAKSGEAKAANSLADIVARKQVAKEQEAAESQETYEAYMNMNLDEFSNLSQEVIDQYQDDPDYLEYLNKQVGGQKDG